jgi:hypothetical protein
MSKYVRYYHNDRTHLALEKGTPTSRLAAVKANPTCKIVSMPRVGGLQEPMTSPPQTVLRFLFNGVEEDRMVRGGPLLPAESSASFPSHFATAD